MKIFKERFIDANIDEIHIEACKVLLCNPPDSRSALIQPLDFLYNEGEGTMNRSKDRGDSFLAYFRCFSIETILSTYGEQSLCQGMHTT